MLFMHRTKLEHSTPNCSVTHFCNLSGFYNELELLSSLKEKSNKNSLKSDSMDWFDTGSFSPTQEVDYDYGHSLYVAGFLQADASEPAVPKLQATNGWGKPVNHWNGSSKCICLLSIVCGLNKYHASHKNVRLLFKWTEGLLGWTKYKLILKQY